jgi:hypothetical protein
VIYLEIAKQKPFLPERYSAACLPACTNCSLSHHLTRASGLLNMISRLDKKSRGGYVFLLFCCAHAVAVYLTLLPTAASKQACRPAAKYEAAANAIGLTKATRLSPSFLLHLKPSTHSLMRRRSTTTSGCRAQCVSC